ncbi:MAG TPA: macro domain-containing protein [Chthoniobacterales bacterium]|jgi:hypothetical protein
MRALKDLWRGLRRHPWKTIANIFVAFSVLWTLTESLNFFVPDIRIKGPVALTAFVVTSVIYGLLQIWKPSKVSIDVKHTNTCIIVLFGDLFLQDGLRAIAVNEFFDSQLGKPVSENSLHGIFLNKCFGGHPEPFDKEVEAQLGGSEYETIQRAEGKTRRFPIGSTALITVDKDRYIAVALTNTDPVSCKASADVTMMWTALHWLWARARVECGGKPLNLPLIGSGLSGVGLPTRDLVNLIILSAITETKEKMVTNHIRLVLPRDRYEEIDLRDVKKHWEN